MMKLSLLAALGSLANVSGQTAPAQCADLSGDGTVDVTDLLLLLSAFASDETGDVDGSCPAGTSNVASCTDVADLLLLLAGFGSTCTRDAGGGGASTGQSVTADVSIIVDNSHTSYCNGVLLGTASAWNIPDTWSCDAVNGHYVIGINAFDGEVTNFGVRTRTAISTAT